MIRNRFAWRDVFVGLSMMISTSGFAHTPPDTASIFFVGLEDGALVKSPVKIEFGIDGFGIIEAGTKDKRRHTAGHHHLLIDVATLPDMNRPIPRDSNHLHFDQGETEIILDLPSGEHSLQLLLGDEDHEPHDPVLVSERITIRVE